MFRKCSGHPSSSLHKMQWFSVFPDAQLRGSLTAVLRFSAMRMMGVPVPHPGSAPVPRPEFPITSPLTSGTMQRMRSPATHQYFAAQ